MIKNSLIEHLLLDFSIDFSVVLCVEHLFSVFTLYLGMSSYTTKRYLVSLAFECVCVIDYYALLLF